MSRYIESVADWEQIVYAPGTPPKRETQRLDFKRDLSDKAKTKAEADEKMALVIAAFANADGGIIAYGAVEEEDPITRIKVCTGTQDLAGDVQEHERRIRNVVKSHLTGIGPPPDIRTLALPNGDRVIAVNVKPSVSLVAVTTPADDVRIRYPVRDGESKRYLQPGEVEQRILSYRGRAAKLELQELLRSLGASWSFVRLVHLLRGECHEVERATRVKLMELSETSLRLTFVRKLPAVPGQSAAADQDSLPLDVPYDWVARTWWHNGQPPMPALLLAATVVWPEGTQYVRLTPHPWDR